MNETQSRGLVHLYWGEGQGKTTAAAGLALRALAAGQSVAFVQLLKGTPSGEAELLARLGAAVYRDWPAGQFAFQLGEAQRAELRARQTALLRRALAAPADLLVLDEACAAWQGEWVDRALLQAAVAQKPAGQELVLTGRQPAPWMLALADYSTELRCCRHPFARGGAARRGVEY